ncbi:RraA family protein [Baekduia soli]|uniref:Putative 4-hydroxy-4-methyl-2-oxoglutarate aldolase n=1 Tax=Baekduia soli TaxID=496014 RepID=A0A5B8U7W9_9ACTN|nr:RraA family protein [Baekduia soli]QEC49206.1 RraA family protein [Baekduia soli]
MDERSLSETVRGLNASVICDARGKRLEDGLDPAIRCLHGGATIAGPAVTARCEPGYGSALMRALLAAGEGDVLVVQGPGPHAYLGELLGAEAARRGVAAIVLDGNVRDIAKLRELPIAVYARGTTPLAGKPGPGEIDVTLTIGAATVAPGDWIIGDADGLIVVPADELPAALDRAAEIEAQENAVWERVRAGGAILDEEGSYGEALRKLAAQA